MSNVGGCCVVVVGSLVVLVGEYCVISRSCRHVGEWRSSMTLKDFIYDVS
jgi:hypothetical protein